MLENNSIKYGLYNPAFHEDIGRFQLGKIIPPSNGEIGYPELGSINSDNLAQLSSDTFTSSQKKNNKVSVWKSIGMGIGIIAAATGIFLGRHKIGALLSTFGKKCSGLFNTLKTKLKPKAKPAPAP